MRDKLIIKHVKQKLKSMKKSLNKSIHVKVEAKTNKTKLGFSGQFMCTHEQPYMRIIKPVCTGRIMHVGFCPETLEPNNLTYFLLGDM